MEYRLKGLRIGEVRLMGSPCLSLILIRPNAKEMHNISLFQPPLKSHIPPETAFALANSAGKKWTNKMKLTSNNTNPTTPFQKQFAILENTLYIW